MSWTPYTRATSFLSSSVIRIRHEEAFCYLSIVLRSAVQVLLQEDVCQLVKPVTLLWHSLRSGRLNSVIAKTIGARIPIDQRSIIGSCERYIAAMVPQLLGCKYAEDLSAQRRTSSILDESHIYARLLHASASKDCLSFEVNSWKAA